MARHDREWGASQAAERFDWRNGVLIIGAPSGHSGSLLLASLLRYEFRKPPEYYANRLFIAVTPRLAVITTHPIQYYAPLFRELAAAGAVKLRVFYGWTGAAGQSAHDPGFRRMVKWDVPLLDGYDHLFVSNASSDPGLHHFRGLDSPDLIASVEAWQPDAVLVFGWNYRSHLRAMRHFSGRMPVLFRGDSTLLDEQPGLRRWVRRTLLRWIYRYVDVALPVGTHSQDYFLAHGLSEEQLVWAPHAIDNRRFEDEDGAYKRAAMAWRAELGVDAAEPVVVFAGKLESKKAPDVLLEAFQLAFPSSESGVARCHLVVGGAGPLESELRTAAAGDDRVHFIGFQNQSRMPVVYRLGGVFVLPSRGPGETWGLAVNEAMACGRAVIVSDRVGCASDLVRDGENGYVVPAGDAKALASVLLDTLTVPSRASKMGEASAARVRAWDIPSAARQIEKATRHALSVQSSVAPSSVSSQLPVGVDTR